MMIIRKKLAIGLILSLSLLSSSCNENKEASNDVSTSTTKLVTQVTTAEPDEIDIKIYTHEEIEEIMNEVQAQSATVYESNAKEVKDTTFIDKTVLLTQEYKYGKVVYSNDSSKDATLIITDALPKGDFNKTIPANKGIGIIWTNNTDTYQTYTVSISTDGSENLFGKISVGKSNVKDE